MTSITVLTRSITYDKNGKKTSDVIYYWLTGKREDLMKRKGKK